jgi:hypothetical protein
VHRRDPISLAVLLLVLALLGGFAWATRHPEAEVLARAEGWPVVGRLAAAFRRAYLPPPPPPAAPAETGEETAAAERGEAAGGPGAPEDGASPEQPGGGRPARPFGGPPSLWIAPGDRLHAAPDADAPVVAEADAFTPVFRFESRGDWHRVRYGVTEGWVRRTPPPPGEPPLPPEVVPPRPLPGRPPDPERLAAALQLLGVEEPAGRLGPYPLYTDLADPGLVSFLDRVAAAVEPAYRGRYGREPVGEAAEVVVLYAGEEGYRAFQDADHRLARLPSSGHAGYGLVALYAGGRRRDEVAATLVHEIVHLLNRRGVGPALPPWLDEGLAADLATGAIGPAGDLDPEAIGGAIERGASRIDYYGAQAAIRRLAAALTDRALPPLPRLFALDWEAFVRSDRLDLHYAAAGFFWRYLLDGEEGALAAPARAYLAATADGGPADAEALRVELDRTWADLEDGFEAWVAEHAEGVDDPGVWLHR